MSFVEIQSAIYRFFIDSVKTKPSEVVLEIFEEAFFLSNDIPNEKLRQAIYEIIFGKNQKVFRNTLKRVCYILINNWLLTRDYASIQQLIQLIEKKTARISAKPYLPYAQKRLCQWLADFVNSEDYQELCLYGSRDSLNHWSHRYTTYLLAPQYLSSSNMIEQREIARKMARQLKDKFKLDLAMYTAHSRPSGQEHPSSQEEYRPNPTTQLGKNVIDLIKTLIPSDVLFDYENYARIFLLQAQEGNYKHFKLNLLYYLAFNFDDQNLIRVLRENLTEKLEDLQLECDQETFNFNLLLQTCRQLIKWLTIQDDQKPSELFALLTSRGETFTTALLLLKVVLICRNVQSYLESCVAKLIHYYENFSEDECRWFIEFIEFLTVLLAVYTENVHYDLVSVKANEPNKQEIMDLSECRLFPQLRGTDLRGGDLRSLNLRGADLSCANLSHADLRGVDLTSANLNFAKLVGADLSRAILKGAKLTVADLREVTLSYAQLDSADLRRTNLQQANLRCASLTAAKLGHANLQQVDLKYANLRAANLIAANLRNANLQSADLQQIILCRARLENSDLQYCNLRDADLHLSKLCGVNLMQSNLFRVDLRDADLRKVTLSKATLTRANLNGANLSNADLKDALLAFTKLNRVSLCEADLARADCSHADLRLGNLSGANLSWALLRHAKLEGADLAQANLRCTNLFDTQLNQVNVEGAQFIGNSGLSEDMKLNLEQQGAFVGTS